MENLTIKLGGREAVGTKYISVQLADIFLQFKIIRFEWTHIGRAEVNTSYISLPCLKLFSNQFLTVAEQSVVRFTEENGIHI